MNKKKSIAILSVISVLIILGCVFAFTSFEVGLYDYTAFPKTIKLGLDLSGGAYAVFDVDTDTVYNTTDDGTEQKWDDLAAEDRAELLEGTRKSLEDMLVSKGYTEAQVTTYDARIRVEVPDVDDPERIFELIGRPASLEFKAYVDGTNDTSFDPKITGKDIKLAKVTLNNETGYYDVALQFNSEGAKKFGDATTANVGKEIAIWLNGAMLIHPKVNEAITTGTASISGQYTYDQAYDLAVKIQAGSFPLTLNMTESNTLTATLGVNAIKAGVIAGLVGLALIVIYLCVLYRLMGVAASIALLYYSLTYIFFLSVFPMVQLTLSGIAGVLLSIGMAVDANVIIFERVKEEYAGGKTMRTSIGTGFRRSMGAIIDGNVTTIIGAVVLIIVGAASIQGFGITLLIGIVLSLLSSLLLTRIVLSSIIHLCKEDDAHLFGLKREESEEDDEEEEVAEAGMIEAKGENA